MDDDEGATVNPSELLELVSGLRARDEEADNAPEKKDYRKGEDAMCKSFLFLVLSTS